MGNQETAPAPCIRGPAMPTNCTPGQCGSSALISWLPNKSPELSPATMPMRMRALAHNPARRGGEEVDQDLKLTVNSGSGRNLCSCLVERQSGLIKRLVSALDCRDLLRRVT